MITTISLGFFFRLEAEKKFLEKETFFFKKNNHFQVPALKISGE